jgi:hypothetical protein
MSNGNSGVGYGIPPKATQFKSGQSGNPKGRPKGAKNLNTLLNRTINERLTITENGKRRTINKLEATVKQLVNKAASGDYKSGQLLLQLVQLVEGRSEADNVFAQPAVADTDYLVMNNIISRIRGSVTKEFANDIPSP